MKIALIDPAGDVSGFNAGLAYLSAALKKSGKEVQVFDLNNYGKTNDDALKEIVDWKADAVGLSIKTGTIGIASEMAANIKAQGIPVVAGGPEVTCLKDDFLKKYPEYSASVIGEAEGVISQIFEDVVGLKNVGRSYGGGSDLTFQNDLNSIPFPDYEVFDSVENLVDMYPLVTSRGCPYDCIYCSVNKVSGRKWRSRSAENVVEELSAAKSKYGIKHFNIADDNFTFDIKRAKEICRLIIKNKLNLTWSCLNGIRADRVDEELLGLMKNAGCTTIWFGIESMDPDVFDSIKKGEKLQNVIEAVSLAKKAGLSVCGFFIAGLPGSTYKKDLNSLEKGLQLGLNEMLWSLATPYPHTEFLDWAEKNAVFLKDYKDVSFFKDPSAVIETSDYKASERIKMFYIGNLRGRSYSCFFSKQITMSQIIGFVWAVLKYDGWNVLNHFFGIFFGKYNRKHLKEAFKRIFS